MKLNWRTPLYSLAGLIGAVLTGALGNKLAGIEWKGLWPFLAHFPAQILTLLLWPVRVSLVILIGLFGGLFWFWRQTLRESREILRRDAEETERVARENELVPLWFSTGDGILWRFNAKRGSPSPKISDLQHYCKECQAPLITYQPNDTLSLLQAQMGDWPRIIECPSGHLEIKTSYNQMQQVEMKAHSIATKTAQEFFNGAISPIANSLGIEPSR